MLKHRAQRSYRFTHDREDTQLVVNNIHKLAQHHGVNVRSFGRHAIFKNGKVVSTHQVTGSAGRVGEFHRSLMRALQS